MHYVQKKAVLALISMVESGLREIRSVLSDQGSDAEPSYVPVRQRAEPQFGSPLDEDEERSLEQVMEQNRQMMLKQGVSMTQAFYEDAVEKSPPRPPLNGFFEGDDT